MSLKLERLCLSIAEREGWKTNIDDPINGGSHSWRNHNPGNLRASPFSIGTKNGFAVFKTDADGFFALHWDIRQKAKGNTVTGLNGDSTLADLIYVWAPASDGNNPEQYLIDIVLMSGIDRQTKLSNIVV